MTTTVQSLDGGQPWYKPLAGPMVLGEAPIYRASDSTLHWVDALKTPSELHILKIDPDSGDAIGSARVLILEDSVSVHFFRKGIEKSYICAYYQGIAFMDEETGKLEVVREIIPTEMRAERRFNDGGIDAKGRFWLVEIDKTAVAFGLGKVPESYGEPKGRLWRYDPDGSLHEMASGMVCGNGVKWSPDNKTFYLNDSMGQKTYAFDFDLESGSISNKRLLVDFRGTDGEPDGLVVDVNGDIWMAVYGSNRIMVFDPAGNKLKDVVFPGQNITCPTWGGKNFDTLFITSASGSVVEGDEGGHMFRFKAGVQGVPKYEFAG